MNTDLSSAQDSAEISIADALAYALDLHQSAHLDAAETLYTRILAVLPEHVDALHFLGVLRHQRGDSAGAIPLIRAASRLAPDYVDSFINLGNVLAETGELEQATDAYRKALELSPTRADIFNNLGVVLKLQNRWDEAEQSYRQAIALKPESASAYNNLGLLYAAQGRIQDAIRYYCQSIELMPGNPDSRRLLGTAYYALGRTQEAAEVFRQWCEADPAHPIARHMYAACSGEQVPDRAADDYIEQTFDHFAESFETQLQERLAYKAPQLVAEALRRSLKASASPTLRILDAGCGTGLCGPLLRPLAHTLIGVDLSAGMLAKAQAKDCYAELQKAELGAFMAGCTQPFDAIVSADTLVYFGPLDTVLNAAHQALKPGGRLVFTVEQAEPGPAPQGFRINPHGRYAHTRSYLTQVLVQATYSLESIQEVVLRNEGEKPVAGWLVIACHV